MTAPLSYVAHSFLPIPWHAHGSGPLHSALRSFAEFNYVEAHGYGVF